MYKSFQDGARCSKFGWTAVYNELHPSYEEQNKDRVRETAVLTGINAHDNCTGLPRSFLK